jgi:predicted transcriptional regulator of viral defense system
MQEKNQEERIIDLLKSQGIMRTGAFDKLGVERKALLRLMEKGVIERIERGLYGLVDSDYSEHETLKNISMKIPGCVVCLLSAFNYHGITTQNPRKVWIAIDRNRPVPILQNLPVRTFRYSGVAYSEGIEKHKIDGVELKVYSPAKSVADGFKYRNKIGLDVAMEALRDSLSQKKCTRDEIWNYAKICRVQNVIRPYLEATA